MTQVNNPAKDALEAAQRLHNICHNSMKCAVDIASKDPKVVEALCSIRADYETIRQFITAHAGKCPHNRVDHNLECLDCDEPVWADKLEVITNHMKATCMGEFKITIQEPEIVEGKKGWEVTGELIDREIPVPWDVCKTIYKAMLKAAKEG